jgi:hypothetical protein
MRRSYAGDLPFEGHIIHVCSRRTLLRIWHRKTLSSNSVHYNAIADVKSKFSNTHSRAGEGSNNLAALPGCPASLTVSGQTNGFFSYGLCCKNNRYPACTVTLAP